MKNKESITGVFKSIRWSNEDGTFFIGFADVDGVSTCIAGNAKPEAFINGVEYSFGGAWKDTKYGKQFAFTSYVAKAPVTDQAVMSYLTRYLFGSGCGIGPAKARKILAAVGAERTIATIKADPTKVCELTGVSASDAKAAAQILIKEEKFEAVRMELVNLFKGRGFTQQLIDRCVHDFGVAAAERIKCDPFTLLVRRYPSAGFARCESLYVDLGLPENKLKRQTICIWYQIQQESGSVWMESRTVIRRLAEMVSSDVRGKKAIELGLRSKWLGARRDKDGVQWLCVNLDGWAETDCSRYLKDLIAGKGERKTLEKVEADAI